MVASNIFIVTNLVLASLAGLAIYKIATFPRPEPLDDIELNTLRVWTRYDRGDFDNDRDAADAVKRQLTELQAQTRMLERSNPQHALALQTELAFTNQLINEMPSDIRPAVFQFYRAYYDVRDIYALSHHLTVDLDPIVFKQILVAARFCQVFLDESDSTLKGRLRTLLHTMSDSQTYAEAADQIVEQMTVVELTELSVRAAQLKQAADNMDQEQFQSCLQKVTEAFADLESRILSKLSP